MNGNWYKTYPVSSKGVSAKTMTYPVCETHRVDKGINFIANNEALVLLSNTDFKLYMHMIKNASDRGWILNGPQTHSKTHLSIEEQKEAIQEMLELGYLTKGPVTVQGKTYYKNAFHLWEMPHDEMLRLEHVEN